MGEIVLFKVRDGNGREWMFAAVADLMARPANGEQDERVLVTDLLRPVTVTEVKVLEG